MDSCGFVKTTASVTLLHFFQTSIHVKSRWVYTTASSVPYQY